MMANSLITMVQKWQKGGFRFPFKQFLFFPEKQYLYCRRRMINPWKYILREVYKKKSNKKLCWQKPLASKRIKHTREDKRSTTKSTKHEAPLLTSPSTSILTNLGFHEKQHSPLSKSIILKIQWPYLKRPLCLYDRWSFDIQDKFITETPFTISDTQFGCTFETLK